MERRAGGEPAAPEAKDLVPPGLGAEGSGGAEAGRKDPAAPRAWERKELTAAPRFRQHLRALQRHDSVVIHEAGCSTTKLLEVPIYQNASFKALSERFQHSSETIHRHIQAAMGAVVAVANDYIKLLRSRLTGRYYPIQNLHLLRIALGRAIDGTHVPITVKDNEAAPYTNKKGTFSQNVMLACDFDLNIVYVSTGWEGSASDAAVLQSAMRSGFRVPRGKELFNLRHAQLRNHIERAIGILKMRFPIMKVGTFHPMETQVKIPLVAAILHNMIRGQNGDESWLHQRENLENERQRLPTRRNIDMPNGDTAYNNDVEHMNSQRTAGNILRDSIAMKMWDDYTRARRNRQRRRSAE
ncbi:hypothetical protein ACP4OV_007233 [Aristida adscensionis]